MPVDIRALIVMAENHGTLAKPGPGGEYALLAGIVLQRLVSVKGYCAHLRPVSTEILK